MTSPEYPQRYNTAGAGPSSSRSSRNHFYRPATIAELAAQAQENLWNPNLGLKHWLRTAEKARRTAEQLIQAHDYEGAFVEYAKAATIVLEKLPTHREYQTLLNADQRNNLGMNGQDILDSLSQLKPILIEKYDQWQSSQRTTPGSSRASSTDPGLSREEIARRRREEQEEERAREAREAARREEVWKQEEFLRRQVEERERQARAELAWRHSGEGRREDVSARRAADARAMADSERADRQRREDEQRRIRQEEVKRDDDRSRRRAADDRRWQEQEGIARRQQEAETASRAARRDISRLTPSPAGGSYRPPEPDAANRTAVPQVYAPQPSRPPPPSQQSSFSDPYSTTSTVSVMPLESPNKYDDDSSTDAESAEQRESTRSQRHDQTPKGKQLLPGSAMPQPILTTTSPPPPELGVIRYPSLMSQHQLKQGYAPSLQSMFAKTHISETPKPDGSLLFESKQQTPASSLYSNILPSQPAPVIPPHPTHMPVPDSHRPPKGYAHQHTSSYPSMRGPSPNGARGAPYPSPSKDAPSHRATPSVSSTNAARIVPGSSRDAQVRELRTIKLPRECLPRFLSIARVNTLQNRETCGLLLGKDRGSKYVVTTLLIPKQHSTSDTCMMDEEELVLQFTEERHLITLGWIHTHPTQSCFMSSVDLHTHSGFQRMLPESFAVVCAPSSTPQFGIFRLTDPGGLQTILECNAKEAFHPHPEVPIYTDCDNCHVQMKDMPLEIVDLR
ncbi:Mov34-domain-containing protein [Pilatotrama ljubarskyi]|nr:Mov34-domain-containing protein [Pilatotrama ljubarskyi]